MEAKTKFVNPSNHPQDVQSTSNNSNSSKGRKAGIVASGVVIGALGSVLMSMKSSDNPLDTLENTETGFQANETVPYVDNSMAVSSSVNDNMSFAQAFAAARSEVGPGGCFEWHGQVYGTYTAEEWNNMSLEEQAEYGSHFNWNNFESTTNTPHVEEIADNTDDEIVVEHISEPVDEAELVAEVELVDEVTEDEEHLLADVPAAEGPMVNEVADQLVTEPDIQVLDVAYDSEIDATIGVVTVDSEPIMYVDADNDHVFDVAISDTNHSGEIEDNEVINIEEEGLTVEMLETLQNPPEDVVEDDFLAYNPEPEF